MDKLATAAKSDKLINARMNAKGMSVGYYNGGSVGEEKTSLNADPTKVDALIDKFMVAAQNSPALMQELASRGVTVNTTGANMNSKEMQSANRQTERAFNMGGLGFTPSNYGLGFSVFGGGSGTGSSTVEEIETIMVEYHNPTTRDTMMIAHDKATNQPTQVVPAGYIMGPLPVETVVPEYNSQEDDTRSASTKLLEESMKDTDWMDRYDYSSTEGLYQTTKAAMEAELEAQHGLIQFIGKFDKTGIMSKRPQLLILGQTNAHIRMLEKQGETSPEEIAELKELAAQYKKANGLDGFAMGLVSNGWGLTDVINDTLGDDLFKSGGIGASKNTTEIITAAQKAKAAKEFKDSEATQAKNITKYINPALKSDSKGQKEAKAQVGSSKKYKTKSGATVGGKTDTQKNLNKVNAQLKNMASGGGGGFNKGGLMKKKKK